MPALQQRFGMRLKLLRVASGFTQEQFAELADVSTALVSNIERGINQPSFKNIERFSSVLQIPERDLFDFRDIGEFQEKSGVRVRAPRKPSTLIVRHKKTPRRIPERGD
jgi:transcriptional regulator with XRE-family HTH domain